MKLLKDGVYIIIISVLIVACSYFYYYPSYNTQAKDNVAIYYNQDIEANKKVMEVIQDADQFVFFAIYTFTRNDIKDALLGAHHRGLEVRGIMDRKQSQEIESQRKIFKELTDAGIPVAMQDHAAIMHLKTVVTEKSYVSGSYNWTASATTRNDEVLEVGQNERIRKQYEKVLLELFKRYQH